MFLNFPLDDHQTQIQSGVRTDLNKGVSAMKIVPFLSRATTKGNRAKHKDANINKQFVSHFINVQGITKFN